MKVVARLLSAVFALPERAVFAAVLIGLSASLVLSTLPRPTSPLTSETAPTLPATLRTASVGVRSSFHFASSEYGESDKMKVLFRSERIQTSPFSARESASISASLAASKVSTIATAGIWLSGTFPPTRSALPASAVSTPEPDPVARSIWSSTYFFTATSESETGMIGPLPSAMESIPLIESPAFRTRPDSRSLIDCSAVSSLASCSVLTVRYKPSKSDCEALSARSS